MGDGLDIVTSLVMRIDHSSAIHHSVTPTNILNYSWTLIRLTLDMTLHSNNSIVFFCPYTFWLLEVKSGPI
jgi:hypothetical protein